MLIMKNQIIYIEHFLNQNNHNINNNIILILLLNNLYYYTLGINDNFKCNYLFCFQIQLSFLF